MDAARELEDCREKSFLAHRVFARHLFCAAMASDKHVSGTYGWPGVRGGIGRDWHACCCRVKAVMQEDASVRFGCDEGVADPLQSEPL